MPASVEMPAPVSTVTEAAAGESCGCVGGVFVSRFQGHSTRFAPEPLASHVVERKVTEYAVADRIATITLKRPHRLNAWTGRMSFEYRTALAEAATDESVQVIVVTGAGRGFCSGADSEALLGFLEHGDYSSGLPDDPPTPGYGVRAEFDADLAYHLAIEKPIIACVNGPAAGLGFALMCYCDVRFAAAGAKLTSAHSRLGLPAEFGMSWMLPRIIGLGRASDVLMSSRIFLAEEALQMGLVNGVVPADKLVAHVTRYARFLAEQRLGVLHRRHKTPESTATSSKQAAARLPPLPMRRR